MEKIMYPNFETISPITAESIEAENHDDQGPDHRNTAMDNKEACGSLVALVSGLYALVLVILSFAFELAIVFSDKASNQKYELFYIYLYAVAICFLVYSYAFLIKHEKSDCVAPMLTRIQKMLRMDKKVIKHEGNDVLQKAKYRVTHSGTSSGSLYLRFGCIMFGMIGVIFYGLKILICYSVAQSCSVSSFMECFLAGSFIFAQMYFIYKNTKIVIHKFKNVGRLGLMHLVATNLCVWIRLLVVEEFSMIHEIEDQKHHQLVDPVPMLPENNFSLLVEIDNFDSTVQHDCENLGSSGESVNCLLSDIKPFMITCIIEYSIMCAGVMYVMWSNIGCMPCVSNMGRKQHFHVDCTRSTSGIFTGLLFITSSILSSIIFFVKTSLNKHFDALLVLYISDCLLYTICITACVIAAYQMRLLSYVSHNSRIMLELDDILLFVGLIGELIFSLFSIIGMKKAGLIPNMLILDSVLRTIQVIVQTMFILGAQRLTAATPQTQKMKPGRNVLTFILMANVALFMLNTFETQKASLNPIMLDFYDETWNIIVHSVVSLTIFYRFHSSVCLAEIWKQVYKMNP